MPEAKYAPVVRALVAAIREIDKSRYLFADGVDYGRIPTPSLYGIPRLGQSCHAYDPHAVTLALMEEEFSLFKDRNLGWALWEFCGGFGILDSGRDDVIYEDFHGHKLDRKMLERLRRY